MSENDSTVEVNTQIVQDSCLNIKKYISAESVDLILTSPPYCNLLNRTIGEFTGSVYKKNIYKGRKLAKPYSKDERDFGNMNLIAYSDNIKKLMKILRMQLILFQKNLIYLFLKLTFQELKIK